MSKLTELERIPRRIGAAPPHQFRKIGGRMLMTRATGEYAFLDKSRPAWSERSSPISWRGPSRHHVCLENKNGILSPETARGVVNFIFSIPSPTTEIELSGRSWPALRFIVQYARRKSEWYSRPLSLLCRIDSRFGEDELRFLAGHRVTPAFELDTDNAGTPLDFRGLDGGRLSAVLAAGKGRLRAWVGEKPADPSRLVDAWRSQGISSVRLEPKPSLKKLNLFFRFYETALDRMIAAGTPEAGKIKEERAEAFLRLILPLDLKYPTLPGLDILAELAYDPRGRIYTGSAGLDLSQDDCDLFHLGEIGSSRYQELGANPLVQTLLAAMEPSHQPLCFQCSYKPYCSLSPSINFQEQKTIWGDAISSLQCSLHMGILDRLFARLAKKDGREILQDWLAPR